MCALARIQRSGRHGIIHVLRVSACARVHYNDRKNPQQRSLRCTHTHTHMCVLWAVLERRDARPSACTNNKTQQKNNKGIYKCARCGLQWVHRHERIGSDGDERGRTGTDGRTGEPARGHYVQYSYAHLCTCAPGPFFGWESLTREFLRTSCC